MDKLTVIKTRSNPRQGEQIALVIGDGTVGHLCSAVWSVPELPGVVLRRGQKSNGGKPHSFWQVVFHSVIYGSSERRMLAEQSAGILQGQKFSTRREAVQALQAALLTITPA